MECAFFPGCIAQFIGCRVYQDQEAVFSLALKFCILAQRIDIRMLIILSLLLDSAHDLSSFSSTLRCGKITLRFVRCTFFYLRPFHHSQKDCKDITHKQRHSQHTITLMAAHSQRSRAFGYSYHYAFRLPAQLATRWLCTTRIQVHATLAIPKMASSYTALTPPRSPEQKLFLALSSTAVDS